MYDNGLAHQVLLHQQERGRFNAQHMEHFRKLACIPGFSGSIQPGVSVEFGTQEMGLGHGGDMTVDDSGNGVEDVPPCGGGPLDEVDDDTDGDELAAQLYSVLCITFE